MTMRQRGTTRSGGAFDAKTIAAVWAKAQVVLGYDPALYRKDACGAWIEGEEYGTLGDRGWEVDHIRPVAKSGGDELANLQPLHWQNNRRKGDDFPNWSCALSAAA